MPTAIIIGNRVADLTATHPQADYTRKCMRCGERVCLYPSSMETMRQHPEYKWDIACLVCVKLNPPKNARYYRSAKVQQETKETYDLAKKKQ